MGRVDRERLNRLLGDPELAWVLDRVRRRVELGQPPRGTIALGGATPAQRDAAARLFGRPPRAAQSLTVSLDDLDALLRRAAIHEGGLVEAVTALTGPIIVRAERRAEQAQAWAVAFERVEAVAAERSALEAWLGGVRAAGVVKRLARNPCAGKELLDALATVIAALPCTAGESLSVFAARVAGSAHALDDGSPLGSLAVGAARALAGLEAPVPGESPAEARREAWAVVGVLCDELSSMVLTLALPGDASPTGRLLAAADAQPVWLTLRQLVLAPMEWGYLQRVLVVENPSVVAVAADLLRARRPPIVCINGQPRAGAMVLLRSLAGAGVRLMHHGDFDWGGITIGNLLHRRLPIEPWRFDRTAYVRAVAEHPHAAPLTGQPVAATWDPGLAESMRDLGRRIEEELVAREILEALAVE